MAFWSGIKEENIGSKSEENDNARILLKRFNSLKKAFFVKVAQFSLSILQA